ncbi:MAG: T9SS type A sorting domain-containing protein [Muribaculaceae bacterium]|nr:T9SS type A sorting domain-containing protein [Muribaculaceae bacterium]
MSKCQIITTLIFLMTFFHGMAMMQTSNYSAETKVLNISKSYQDNLLNEDMNLKHFEVNIPEDGYYYAEFWLLPAQYSDGSFTKFSIYANDVFIGHIIPNKGNWQSIRINDRERIELKKGHNIITIAVPAPEVPSVEKIKLASTDEEANISASAYQKFYDEAVSCVSYDVPDELFDFYSANIYQENQTSNIQEFAVKHFADVPLKYTFYDLFTFHENETIEIQTSSLSEHDVDILFLGEMNNSIIRPRYISKQDSLKNNITNIIGRINPENFTSHNYNCEVYEVQDLTESFNRVATSEEQQGLNWKGISRKSKDNLTYRIFKRVRIPQKGVYLIRLRHRESGKTGTVNLAIGNLHTTYMYNDVPITFSWMPCEIPANGKEYSTMTFCNNSEKDNPMLFIHGAVADRIVGFADDAPEIMRLIHELSTSDSYIQQQYKVKTSGISVCNYSSSQPESKCEILAGIDETILEPDPGLFTKPKSNQSENMNDLDKELNTIKISGSLEQCSILTITSLDNINNVIISDIDGKIIKTIKGNGSEIKIFGDSLNLKKTGIFVVYVETDKGSTSKKILFE